jgi:aromatic ring-opening dioxygenase catalytic subunit (LigB family)
MAARMPTLYAAHGGGPLPLLGDAGHAALSRWFQSWPGTVPKPKSVLVISAQWEASFRRA